MVKSGIASRDIFDAGRKRLHTLRMTGAVLDPQP